MVQACNTNGQFLKAPQLDLGNVQLVKSLIDKFRSFSTEKYFKIDALCRANTSSSKVSQPDNYDSDMF